MLPTQGLFPQSCGGVCWERTGQGGLTGEGVGPFSSEAEKRHCSQFFVVHVLHSPAEPDLTSKSDTKVATRPATGPGSRLPSTAPPVGTTGVVSKETTYVPVQTAAKAPEHTHPALQDTPG